MQDDGLLATNDSACVKTQISAETETGDDECQMHGQIKVDNPERQKKLSLRQDRSELRCALHGRGLLSR